MFLLIETYKTIAMFIYIQGTDLSVFLGIIKAEPLITCGTDNEILGKKLSVTPSQLS